MADEAPTDQGGVMVEQVGHIATITLSQPEKRNAISPWMWEELGRRLADISADPKVRVAVLTGAGQHFCAGADLSVARKAEHPLQRMQRVNRTVLALHRLPVPTIARVDGVAVGAGCNLALGCDLIVASDRARFAEIFARRAMSVDTGGSWLLPRLIGLHRAKELCLLADIISAAQAREIGLVNRIVAASDLDATVSDLAGRLAELPPIAAQLVKRQLNDSFSASFEEALQNEANAQSVNLQGADSAQAVAAFLEKRPGNYTGGGYRSAP